MGIHESLGRSAASGAETGLNKLLGSRAAAGIDRDWRRERRGDMPGRSRGAPPAPGRAALWLGAVSSAALVCGVAVWAWDLATRDSAAVPVVRAMSAPARVAPEEPGGFRADHQGFAVNGVASDEPDLPLAERITLAPPATGLTDADRAAAQGPAPAPEPEAEPRDALRRSVDNALRGLLGEPEAQAVAPPTPTPRPMPRPSGGANGGTGGQQAATAAPAGTPPL